MPRIPVRGRHFRAGNRLKARYPAADLVQDTILKAQRDFAAFEAATRPGSGWLAHLRNLVLEQRRHFKAQGRDVAREVPIDAAGAGTFVDGSTSPSGKASRRERSRCSSAPGTASQTANTRSSPGESGKAAPSSRSAARLECSHVNALKIYEQAKEDLARQLSRLEDELS